MTSTAPGAHPLPEEVDALLDPSGGDAEVAAHVAGCEQCLAVRAELSEVRSLLGAQARTLPPEPPDLGARIAAALAAEPAPGRGPAGVPVQPGWDRSEGGQVLTLPARRRWPAYLAVAASVAVVGLGGTLLVTGTVGGGGADSGSAAPQGVSELDDSGGAGAESPGITGLPPTAGAEGGSAAAADGVRTSGTRYTRADLNAQAGPLLLGAEDSSGTMRSQESLADAGTREACLIAVGLPGAEPVATDLATFEGEPAAVLVLPAAPGYDVVVVPAGCGRGDDRVLARTHLD